MTSENEFDTLAELFAQIERAWLDRHDRHMVRDLSEKHPDLREQLYEFFADLVLGDESVGADTAEADDRISRWLVSSGLDVAAEASVQARSNHETTRSASPATGSVPQLKVLGTVDQNDLCLSHPVEQKNWIFFLRKRTKQSLPSLVKELTNVTTEYLILVSRHPNVVPIDAKKRLAENVEQRWGVPAKESAEFLSDEPRLLRAASRSKAFAKDPKSFNELLNRACLTAEQKQFWLGDSRSRK